MTDECKHHNTYWDDDQAYRGIYYEVCCQCNSAREVDEHGIPYKDSEWEND